MKAQFVSTSHSRVILLIVGLLIGVALGWRPCAAEDMSTQGREAGNWEPWAYTIAPEKAMQTSEEVDPSINPLSAMLGVWHVLTDQDGATCPFRPSCSGYMITAIRKHGVIVGWMMGMDRYLRDHKWANEDDYPVIEDYLYDPVE